MRTTKEPGCILKVLRVQWKTRPLLDLDLRHAVESAAGTEPLELRSVHGVVQQEAVLGTVLVLHLALDRLKEGTLPLTCCLQIAELYRNQDHIKNKAPASTANQDEEDFY
ncbi:hypothetical protein IscW_ISCW010819 [Ixodes scapularis]|uniref:Uncharacterized protein n=1 Tax=Ixodes scapularis TaxID=6945 RepID=B7Q9E2_IXOSC|nr:hypothetical protein IscW_ISCW010819 [Ixodes scapularis]|eukprot:XP_002405823.1 hypothetical protein IscW_ISCW010819 [Ixodes scapularis]